MWNTKIEEREITFVIQGKIQGNTINEVVSSILKNFPDSKIILSTWDYDRGNITHFVEKNVDEIIYNIDPGDHTEKDDKPININRQIVSSRAGIQAVKTKYCVKTRTDLLFTNNNLLTIDSSFERDQEYKVFSDWVHVLDVTTRSHLKYEKRLYWICDFVYFGITEDLKYIFDVKNFSKGDFIYLPENFKHRYKYSPETYLGLMSLQRDNGSEVLENSYEYDDDKKIEYENYLINNYIVNNIYQIGINSTKYHLPFNSGHIMLSNYRWKRLKRCRLFQYYDIHYEVKNKIYALINRVFKRRSKEK